MKYDIDNIYLWPKNGYSEIKQSQSFPLPHIKDASLFCLAEQERVVL
jgi:hypothetical protein